MSKARELGAWSWGKYVPLNDGYRRGENGGELPEQVWSVAGLLKLFNYTDDDSVVDALCIDLCLP